VNNKEVLTTCIKVNNKEVLATCTKVILKDEGYPSYFFGEENEMVCGKKRIY